MKEWELLETYVARIVFGKKTPASGAGVIKGDIQTPYLIIECKQRSIENRNLSLNQDWFDTVEEHAKQNGKTPILAIRQTRGNDPPIDVFYCRLIDYDYLLDDKDQGIQLFNDRWGIIDPKKITEFCLRMEKKETQDSKTKKSSSFETAKRSGFQTQKTVWAKLPFPTKKKA